MAIEQFSFSKTWRDREAFPTYQNDETQVREDMQVLHDELAAYVNGSVVPAVNAAASAAQAANAAAAAAQSAAEEAALGQIPDDSLTAAKLAKGGAAGWENVTSAITLTPAEPSKLEVSSYAYRYSRTLDMVFFWVKLYVTASAGESLYLNQTGYDYGAGLPSMLPVTMLGRFTGCLRMYDGRKVQIQVSSEETVSSKPTYIAGWYFCDGPETEET